MKRYRLRIILNNSNVLILPRLAGLHRYDVTTRRLYERSVIGTYHTFLFVVGGKLSFAFTRKLKNCANWVLWTCRHETNLTTTTTTYLPTSTHPSSTISHFLLTTTPIMRASSSIIAVLAFAPAANSRSAGRLRTTIRHHHAVEDRRAQTTNDSIRCTWDDKFDVNGNNHFKVCKKLKDEHTVPYTCDGQFAHVCCTVSSIEIPIFEKFGTCFKVGAATVREYTWSWFH